MKEKSYLIPRVAYLTSSILYTAGMTSELFYQVPRPIRWHLASVTGAALVACIGNQIITARPSNLQWDDPDQYGKNKILLAAAASEVFILAREKMDQYASKHQKFDNVDFWGGTAMIFFAVAAYKLGNRLARPKIPKQLKAKAENSAPKV